MSSASTVVENIIDVDGHAVHVRIEGDGEPMLLLSGLGQPLESWDPFLAALSSRRIVRFDVPGVGQSATPNVPSSISTLAEIAAAVLDAVAIDEADVVGFSLGGAIAQQLAYSSPTKVRRLVLVATSCGLGASAGRWDSSDNWHAPVVAATLAKLPSIAWQALAFATWSSIPFLGSLTQPTLVVCALEDVVAPLANGRVLASRIPHARLVTLEGGHGLLRPGPATELAGVVEEFLSRLDLDPDIDPLIARLHPVASSSIAL